MRRDSITRLLDNQRTVPEHGSMPDDVRLQRRLSAGLGTRRHRGLVVSAPTGVTWINVDGLGDTATLTRLGECFGLHPLALEDVLNVGQRPKVVRYDKTSSWSCTRCASTRARSWKVVVLQRDDSQLVTAETRLFLRDVYDHAVQALE